MVTKRIKLRISLRALLSLVGVCCLLLGGLFGFARYEARQASSLWQVVEREETLVAALHSLDYYCFVEKQSRVAALQPPCSPAFIRRLSGASIPDCVTSLTICNVFRLADEGGLAGLSNPGENNPWPSRFSDQQLPQLNNFPCLEVLDLADTSITDLGLLEIAKLSNLKELILPGTSVSQAGVEALQQALPHCKITVLQARENPWHPKEFRPVN